MSDKGYEVRIHVSVNRIRSMPKCQLMLSVESNNTWQKPPELRPAVDQPRFYIGLPGRY